MIISGQVSENTLQLNQSGGGRIDIPLPKSNPEINADDYLCAISSVYNWYYDKTNNVLIVCSTSSVSITLTSNEASILGIDYNSTATKLKEYIGRKVFLGGTGGAGGTGFGTIANVTNNSMNITITFSGGSGIESCAIIFYI